MSVGFMSISKANLL